MAPAPVLMALMLNSNTSSCRANYVQVIVGRLPATVALVLLLMALTLSSRVGLIRRLDHAHQVLAACCAR